MEAEKPFMGVWVFWREGVSGEDSTKGEEIFFYNGQFKGLELEV